MKFGLKQSTIDKIKNVFFSFEDIEKVIIYGSRAKGNYRNGSDIDLTFFGRGLDITILNKISIELDDLLLPYSFDLSIFEQIKNEDLIAHINRVGVIFFQKEL